MCLGRKAGLQKSLDRLDARVHIRGESAAFKDARFCSGLQGPGRPGADEPLEFLGRWNITNVHTGGRLAKGESLAET
jgi:hypothetical protein